MKNIVIFLFCAFSSLVICGQTPHKMSYQAVIRDSNGDLVINQVIGIKISILKGSFDGVAVYEETQNPETNSNGLMSLEIGGTNSNVFSGDISEINWSSDLYFIKTETDPNGGTDYTIVGTSQLLSVPYALHANTAEKLTGEITYEESDPIFNSSIAAGIQEQDTANWNNKLDQEIDGSIDNEIQSFSVSETGDTLFLSKGNWVIVPNISSANNYEPPAPVIMSNSLTTEAVSGGTNVTLSATIDNPFLVIINSISLAVLGPSGDIYYSNIDDTPTLTETDPGVYQYEHTFLISDTAPSGEYTWIDMGINYEGGDVYGIASKVFSISN